MSYKYLFGPVLSRRLGISLGVDLLQFKTCSLDCIYCECGKTTNLTLERKEYVNTDAVISELKDYLNQNPILDFITFSGSGEPTLHNGIGKIINYLKKEFPNYSIALLTNSTLLGNKDVQNDIKNIDLLLPSLDAISQEVFYKINRPCNNFNNQNLIDGLINFRKIFIGKIWLELFIIPGINDTDYELKLFKDVLIKINPDIIQLNSIDRPGTEKWVIKSDQKNMERIKEFLKPLNTEIIAKYNENITINKNLDNNIIKNILSIIKRRPCTFEDILKITGIKSNILDKSLNSLIKKNIIEISHQDRDDFYKIKNN